MLQALGLVETKGLVGAIVAADAMLKAANVTLIGKEKIAPALITIKIVGETAAVKSAVEAGAEAAQRVGQLIATHLIPHPNEQMGILFPEYLLELPGLPERLNNSELSTKPEGSSPKFEKVKKERISKKEKKSPDVILPEEIAQVLPEEVSIKAPEHNASLFDEVDEIQINQTKSTLERLKAEALNDLTFEEKVGIEQKPTKGTVEDEAKTEGEISSFPLNELESFNVHQLRKLARGVELFPIHGREISRANREILLAYFKSLKK